MIVSFGGGVFRCVKAASRNAVTALSIRHGVLREVIGPLHITVRRSRDSVEVSHDVISDKWVEEVSSVFLLTSVIFVTH